MGNVKSQSAQKSKSSYLLYLIHRTWKVVVDNNRSKDSRYDIDRETDLSSRCSVCRDCGGYHQDSLMFDSESDMAPNAEEDMLVVKPRGPKAEKERLRPPTYNAEDYAIALRRWGKRPMGTAQSSQGTLPSTTSSSSGYVSGSGEMTLRQFTSVSELLNKLRADLRLAFPSFVQEFVSPPVEGINLLLETLRGIQLTQTLPHSTNTAPRFGTRRATLDELGCVECLAACAEKCADTPRLLAQAHPGLLALAVCLTSSSNRSRVLALQLLTKVCHTVGGHAAVSEAVSTLRLKYGEGGRFRFLAGALLAPRAAIALRVAGISFLNAFLSSAPKTQTKLYIQAEACEAGLEPNILQKWQLEIDNQDDDSLTDLLHKEVQKWAQQCVDVEALQRRLVHAEEACRMLSNKVCVLQNQLQQLQLEKKNNFNTDDQNQKILHVPEDEGISSSERSSSSDLKAPTKVQDNDQETTIDDVIEELRIIVKDAEEEYKDQNRKELKMQELYEVPKPKSKRTSRKGEDPKKELTKHPMKKTYFGCEDFVDGSFGKPPADGVKIVIKGPEVEDAIVPAILHPQPPRRVPLCFSAMLAPPLADEVYDDLETLGDGSDSLLSASKLKYQMPKELPVKSPVKSPTPKEKQPKSEEKKKYLRRATSHDPIDSRYSSPKSKRSGSRVESRIRKFESLNLFDPEIGRVRRAESFHQISQAGRERCSSRGGSDSGLFYFTDYDLNVEAPLSPALTKSLDRIDEGLDSMIIVADGRRWPRPLRNDEFYEEHATSRRNGEALRAWDRGYDRFVKDPGIFGGKAYDAFGLQKSRQNAGKYSGNRLPREGAVLEHKRSNNRSKVTDVVSGLY